MDHADAFRRAEGAVPADVRDRLARPSPWPAGVRRTRRRSWTRRAMWVALAGTALYFGVVALAAAGIGKPTPAAMTDPGRGTLSALARAVAHPPVGPPAAPAPVPVPIPRPKPAPEERATDDLERALCEAAARIAIAYRADDGLPPTTAAEVAMIEAAWRDANECAAHRGDLR